MPSKSELQLRIALKEEVSQPLKALEKRIEEFGKKVDSMGAGMSKAEKDTETLNIGMGRLTGAMIKANIAAELLTRGLDFIVGGLRDLSRETVEAGMMYAHLERLELAMAVLSDSTGNVRSEIVQMRNDIRDLNLTSETATNFINELLRANIDMSQAMELAARTMDLAVASGINTNEAMQRVTTAIQTAIPWQLRQLGITVNLNELYSRYAETLGKTADELTEFEKKQAIANTVIERGNLVAGLYEQSLSNAEKAWESFGNRVIEIQTQLGAMLAPLLTEIITKVYKVADAVNEWVESNAGRLQTLGEIIRKKVVSAFGELSEMTQLMGDNFSIATAIINKLVTVLNTLYQAARIVANALQIAARTIITGFENIKDVAVGLKAFFERDFEGVADAWDRISNRMSIYSEQVIDDVKDMWDAVKKTSEGAEFDINTAWASLSNDLKDKFADITTTGANMFNDMSDRISDAAKRAAERMRKALETLNDSLERLKYNFEYSLRDLVISHNEKTEKIKEQIEEENIAYIESMEELKERYDETMADIEKSHADKVDSIKKKEEDERKKIEEEQRKVIEKYMEGIIQYKEGMRERLANLQGQLDTEIAKGEHADKEKIALLKGYLEAEQKSMEEQLAYKEELLNTEMDAVNDEHKDRLEELKNELDEEIKAYEDAKNEKTLLYEEETANLTAEYEERRSDLDEQLEYEYALREKYAEDFAKFKDAIAEDDIARLKRVYEKSKEYAYQSYTSAVNTGFDPDNYSVTGYFGGKDTEGYKTYKAGKGKKWSDLPDYVAKGGTPTSAPFAMGGIVTRPTSALIGEAGAEAVIPLTKPNRAKEILSQAGMGNNITVNAPITVVDNEIDIDYWVERIAYKLSKYGMF